MLAVAGGGRIACNQVLYHLKERAIEHAVIPWCEANGVAVVAYSPFGHNDFPQPRSKGGEVLQADRRRAWRVAAPGRAGVSDARASRVCDSKGRRRPSTPPKTPRRAISYSATRKSLRSTKPFRAGRSREACRCCSGHGFLTKCFRGDDELPHRCGGASRAIAHIGFPLSGLVDGGQLSFLGLTRFDNFRTEFNRDPAPRRSRQAGPRFIAFAREEVDRTHRARRGPTGRSAASR